MVCEFCRHPYSAEALRSAIPCPGCRELNVWGATRCFKDEAWLVIQCLFCGNVSPHNQSGCLACGEAFMGMRERKAARDAQIQEQKTAKAVQVWGGVGASFLGSMVSGMVVHGVSHSVFSVVDLGGGWFD